MRASVCMCAGSDGCLHTMSMKNEERGEGEGRRASMHAWRTYARTPLLATLPTVSFAHVVPVIDGSVPVSNARVQRATSPCVTH